MICQTAECNLDAYATILWPGSDPMAMCVACIQHAIKIAAVMSFHLPVVPLAVAAEPLAQEVETALVPVRHLLHGLKQARCGAKENDMTSSIALTTCEACLKEVEYVLGLRPASGA